jgi:putative ABC transport system permease protein
LQDLRYACRTLARNPGFALVAVLSLAIGIGANTAVFSFVNAVVLRPLALRDSNGLVMVRLADPATGQFSPFPITAGDFLDWQSQNRVFATMAAFTTATFSLTDGGDPERLLGATVTSGFFETAGVSPIAGRTFGLRDSGRDGSDVAVIGAAVWRRRFHADPGVVGTRVLLEGKPYTLIGVMPPGFTFPTDAMLAQGQRPTREVEVWTPLELEANDRSSAFLQVVAHLKTAVTLEQAQAEMSTIARAIEQRLAKAPRPRVVVRIVDLREWLVRDVRPLLFVLLGAVGFMLLIACTNVANLLLGRAVARQREVAIRAALGAGRGRLVRHVLTESVVLSLVGGLTGLLVAVWGVEWAAAFVPRGSLPRLAEVTVDVRVLAFTLALSVATGLLFGLAPALRLSKADVTTALKSAGPAQTARSRFFNLLVVAEVALAFVLLAGAGLLVKSFMRLTSVDPGFRPESILTVSVTLPEVTYPTAREMRRFAANALDRVRGIPGVVHVGTVNWLPLLGPGLSGSIVLEDVPQFPRGLWTTKPAVSAEYFEAMAIPLLRGRLFTDRDSEQAPGVAIVTDGLARQVWPGQVALGKRVKLGFGRDAEQPWLSIVGVVGDVKQAALGEKTQPAIYVPWQQAPRPFLLRNATFVARTAGDPMRAAAAIREQIRSVDPTLPFDRVQTMQQVVSDSVSEPRFRSVVFAGFAVVALALVGVGILGVLGHAVSRRTREIGMRMALGAQRADVLRLVVRQALAMTIAGVVLGAVAAAALTRLLASFLYDVRPLDPATFAAAAVALVAVALVASYVPARRATGVDPMVALRSE